ncbi:hypothetical protein [Williamsia sp.]|uniref:hypothetical protein n=1 Tax=Williamsia sp. TaxID=1872085 RepID=UPI002F941356
MKTFQKDPYGLFKKICPEENQMNPNQTKTDHHPQDSKPANGNQKTNKLMPALQHQELTPDGVSSP